jgi:hypothetical protein
MAVKYSGGTKNIILMAETIKIPQVDLTYWKTLIPIKLELIIHETHIQYIEKCKGEEQNKDTYIWEERSINIDYIHLKKDIVGVDVVWNHNERKNYIRINLNGAKNDWVIYFDSRNEATEVRDKILQWLTT